MGHEQCRRCAELDREIPIRYSVQGIAAYAIETEFSRHHLAVDWIGRAGKRSRAKRELIYASATIGQPRAIAFEHLVVRHQVMAEADRLRHLQMGEARHDRIGMLLGQIQQLSLQRTISTSMSSMAVRSHRRTSVAT